MKALAVVAWALPAIVLVFFLLKWKATMTRKTVEKRLEEDGIEADILSGLSIPPLRLWLRNRKGDGWAKLRMKNGEIRYARVRSKLLGGEPVEFFD